MNTPEEAELATKKAELERLSQLLAEKELDLEELKLTVAAFQHRYYSQVGKRKRGQLVKGRGVSP